MIRAIVKALYRPASFFRGFLFPFLETKNAILKQAEIISSALSRTSFSGAHAAAAIYHCCGIEYSGILNVVLKCLIEKKFGLPKVIIDRVSEWFVQFRKDGEMKTVPLIWYQMLTSFVKQYSGSVIRAFER